MFGKKNKKPAEETAAGDIVKTGHDGKNRVVTWSKGANGHTVGCPEIGKCEEGLTEKEAEKFFEECCANTQNQ